MNGITEYTVAEIFDYIHRVIEVTSSCMHVCVCVCVCVCFQIPLYSILFSVLTLIFNENIIIDIITA